MKLGWLGGWMSVCLSHAGIVSKWVTYLKTFSTFGSPITRPSESYLTPPRWRGLGNGSTPVSHNITTRFRKVDENVDPANKLGGYARLSLTRGLGCPIGVGPAWGSALLVSWFVHWVSAAGETGVGLVSPSAVWHWDMCCTPPRLRAM